MNARAPFLVGLVVLTAIAGMSWFVVATNKDQFSDSKTYILYADFEDASGIRWKTRLQINGLDVGKIDEVKHLRTAQGKLVARARIRLLNEYEVYDNAQLKKEAESLLGDFRLDLDPGTADHSKLAEGDVIPNVRSHSEFEEIQSELLRVSQNVNAITESFAKVLGGTQGQGSMQEILTRIERTMENIEGSTHMLRGTLARNEEAFSDIVTNIESLTRSLALTTGKEGDVNRLAHNLANFSEKVNDMADHLSTLVKGDDTASTQVASLKSTVTQLNEAVTNLNEVTQKINTGKGTVGKVINDPAIADKMEQTLDSTNNILGSISGLQTKIELRSEYGVPFGKRNELLQAAIKNTVALKIFPKPDKYYIIEAIADPRGRTTRKLTTTGSGSNAIKVQETLVSFNDLKFSAMMAKRYYFLTMRFGIIENTGGLGLNLHTLQDDLEFRFDVYDFDRRDPDRNETIFPRLRTTAMYEIVNHIAVQGGLDDPLNQKLRTWFLGGVLRFTDDDLRSMLLVAQ